MTMKAAPVRTREQRTAFARAVLAGVGTAVPTSMDTEEVGEDGYLLAMPEEDKRRDQLLYARELEKEAREAERDGDHHRAAWARHHASCERRARRRPAQRPRPRGAGRPKARTSSARRSSERSGDSGEGGSEPPGRTCVCGCGESIDHRAPQAKYLNDQHGDADRQRRKRARSRDWSADVSRADPYLRREPEEVARARRRVEEGCRCNGHHIADGEDGHCVKCGHRRGSSLPVGFTVPARSAETRRARNSEVVA